MFRSDDLPQEKRIPNHTIIPFLAILLIFQDNIIKVIKITSSIIIQMILEGILAPNY